MGSKAGDDARYKEREAAVAKSLPGVEEYSTFLDRTMIDYRILPEAIDRLLQEHLGFEDDVTAMMIAEEVKRGTPPKHLQVTVTALAAGQRQGQAFMRALWQVLLSGKVSIKPKCGSAEQTLDEIALLRKKVTDDVEKRQQARFSQQRDRSPPPDRQSRQSHYDEPRRDPDRAGRRVHCHSGQRLRASPSRPATTTKAADAPGTFSDRPSTEMTWQRALREKAWQAASKSEPGQYGRKA